MRVPAQCLADVSLGCTEIAGGLPPGKWDTGLFGFPVCLLWGDVTDSGVDRPTIVTGFDGREQVAPRGIAVGVFALMDEFGFQGADVPPGVFGTPD